MELKRDGRDHLYADVDNIRITYIPSNDRSSEANWAGSDVIRIQAYKGEEDLSLHFGAELPVPNQEAFSSLLSGLCSVYVEGKVESLTNNMS